MDYQPIRRIEARSWPSRPWSAGTTRAGRLEPAQFLDAAQRYRLTGAIAERVLDIALGDLASWRVDGVPLTLSLNLSAADLRDETIVSTVANALLAHRLPAKVLTIDISEAGLMEDLERVHGVIDGPEGPRRAAGARRLRHGRDQPRVPDDPAVRRDQARPRLPHPG